MNGWWKMMSKLDSGVFVESFNYFELLKYYFFILSFIYRDKSFQYFGFIFFNFIYQFFKKY